MIGLSREAARILIRTIREDNGGISPEDRAICTPAILRTLESARRTLGSATKTLATDLHSKDTRFVYELIQNADDNQYTRAEAEGSQPYLRFGMYPDRIMLDSNEDGFSEDNVKAICSARESTKTVAQGYIGEKGIGFKSVFKVAKKVHIQSEPFSFSFEYTKDSSDDGLEMVTPIDEEYHDLPEDVTTRITLTLLDPSSPDQSDHDLFNIPDALLLFLTKIKVLHIDIYPENGSATRTTYSHLLGDVDKSEIITKKKTIGGTSTDEELRFHVIRKEVNNLPSDKARKHSNQATVVLAFPVDKEKNDTPIIQPQHVFAFLPLHLAGFTFLIQSDFITKASPEDVLNSTRSKALLSGVADAFRDAVLHFCNHPTLQYQWMRYLPNDSISDEFWKSLRPQIIQLLKETRCLRSWSEKSLYPPNQLYRLNDNFKDRHGEPLFPDSVIELYLSRNYNDADFQIITSLGTSYMSYLVELAILQEDLIKKNSKMKALATEEDWHTRVAKILSELLQSGSSNPDIADHIRIMKLIPLQNDTWVSANTKPIYLPTTEETSIPFDLGLNLVEPGAVSNIARKELFLLLGVTSAHPSTIIFRISERYRAPSFLRSISAYTSAAHLHYLFYHLPEDATKIDENIFLINHEFEISSRQANIKAYIYFEEGDSNHGPWELLRPPPPLNNSGPPGLAVNFLNSEYFEDVPPTALNHGGRTWRQWLTKFAGVYDYPQLKNIRTTCTLSDEFKYIMEHRPEKLVGLLERYWHFYEPEMVPSLAKQIGNCVVPSAADTPVSLENTFLPFPRRRTVIKGLKISHFPFLILPKLLIDENENEWKFLERFGVKTGGAGDQLHFYAKALSRIASENEFGCTPDMVNALFEVYSAIERNCLTPEDTTYICNLFKTQKMIYLPQTAVENPVWVTSDACVWTAPEWLQSKRRLDGILKYPERQHLFCVILKINSTKWQDYLEDLKALKAQNTSSAERVVKIYGLLWREFQSPANSQPIQTLFEEDRLIFVPSQNTWDSPSSCIWVEDQIGIPQKVSIKTSYANLENFFCKMLGVPKPDLKVLVQMLVEFSKIRPFPPISKFKPIIMHISSLGPTARDLEDLKMAYIFSVTMTNGKRGASNINASFAIIDRLEYGSAFKGQLEMLDYSIEEVHACRNFLLALDPKRKYLSELVEERTTVRDGAIDTKLSHSFRMKANALLRCAVHFHSQKCRDDKSSLYNKLLGATMYVSDGISKSLSVVQNGKTKTIENLPAKFHLEETSNELRLYVPRDEKTREECFFRQLPRALVAYLGICDPAAEALLNGILSCRILDAVDGILEDAGVGDVDTFEIEPTQITPLPGDRGAPVQEVTESQTSTIGTLAPAFSAAAVQSIRNEVDMPIRSIGFKGPTQSEKLKNTQLSEPTQSTVLTDNAAQEKNYASLLDRVIKSAARITIPAKGSQSVDFASPFCFGQPLLPPLPFGARSVERDRKVGAAGELLAFEILLNLGLAGFTKSNWQSMIRNEVCVHDKYRNLAPWSGLKIADFTYNDTKGELTTLFIDKGYLQSTWATVRPNYYFTVRTTTGDCSEQFYMSSIEYNWTQSMQLRPQRASPLVYIILRVFNLEGKVGLRIFMDPETSRHNGELEFNAEGWTVRPKMRF